MTKTCASDGCERRAKSLGLCLKHWQRAYATRQDGPRCKADGCKRAAICLGLCAAHYQRQRQHGDVAAHQPVETYELWSPEEDALLARVLASVPPSGRVEDGTWPDVALILARTHGAVRRRATVIRRRLDASKARQEGGQAVPGCPL